MRKLKTILFTIVLFTMTFSAFAAGNNKKSGKSASFTRDYEKWRRVYSKDDISKGLYKSNYKNIPVSSGEKVSFTVTMKDKGDTTLSCTSGIFDIDDYQLSIFYNPEMGWQIITKSNNIKTLNYKAEHRFDLSEEKVRIGTHAEMTVKINDKIYDLVFALIDAGKGDYRVFIKNAPDSEKALCEKDSSGIEYYDAIDMRFGIYKPGFKLCNMKKTTDDSYTKYFDTPEGNDCVYICDYNGFKFLVGPVQEHEKYVKNLDGSVIFNPEKQIRYRIEDKNGKSVCNQKMSYGWEGKVRLGEKDVVLAVIKWSNAVSVFVKE